MQTPIVIINFKNYKEAGGQRARSLACICDRVAAETSTNIAIAVPALDLAAVAAEVSIPVLAQHVDAASYGSSTGHLVPAAVKAAGATGTLLNHAEHPLGSELEEIHATAKGAGLSTVVCAATADDARAIALLRPDFIAVEPPDLIGGDISVTSADPGIITASLAAVPDVPLLVGAGVKTNADVATAIELGAQGVLLASGVTKAEDPESVLRDLVARLV